MGCFSPDMPAQPNYGQINRDTLQAQVDLAPQQFAAESNPAYGQPAYSNLALANLNTILNGTAGGETYSTTSPFRASQKGWYDASGQYVGGDQNAPVAGATWLNKGGRMAATTSYTTKATPGLNALQAGQASYQRGADIADVSKYGLQAHDAMLAANPETASLLAKLNRQAGEGLDAGSALTADEQRQMQQASRAAFAARGVGGGNQALADELLRQFNLGQTLLRQRQQFAQGLIGTNQVVVGDPFLQILGRPASVASAQGVVNGAGPSLFNPQAGLGLAQGNYATNAQVAAATPTTFQNIVGGATAAGSLMSGAAKAFGVI